MKRKRKYSFISLTNLYLNFIFQKTTIIIFIVSLILMSLIIFFISNPFLNINTYLLNKDAIELSYLKESLFIIKIFNLILCSTISIVLILNATSFDKLFLSYIKRTSLSFTKILSSSLIILLLTIFEVTIIYLNAFISYPYFKMNISIIPSILEIFSSIFFDLILTFLITTLFTNIFTPMISLFVFITFNIIYNNYNENLKILNKILPIIIVSDKKELLINTPFVTLLYIIIFTILYIAIYSLKDIS